jgi:hypothetical protein
MLSYARDLMQKYNICYAVGITLKGNTINFRTNALPCQPNLNKCLIKPLTIMTITSESLDFLLINSQTREIQRLTCKPDDTKTIEFLRKQGLDNFTYSSTNLDSDYSILLYLETRLMNPHLTTSELNDLIRSSVTSNYFIQYKEKVDQTIIQLSGI